MQANDYEKFARMITLVAEQYSKALSPDMVRFYFDGLNHLPLESVSNALNRHVRNPDVGQFMPKVADVIKATDGDSEDAAYRALVILQKAFHEVGAWRSVAFDDAVIQAVVHDMGGWPELCARDSEEWQQFGSKEFIKRYRHYVRGGSRPNWQDLPGLTERGNAAKGIYQHERPVSIGIDYDAPKLRGFVGVA